MRAMLNGITMARKLLRKRGLPILETALVLYVEWNSQYRASGKKYCSMPKAETTPDDIRSVYAALNSCALFRICCATIRKKIIQHIKISNPDFLSQLPQKLMAGVMEAAVDTIASSPKANMDRCRGEVKILLQFSL
jgi:hypothetical protein